MSDTREKPRPRAPKGLKSAAARTFWKQVLDAFECDPNELILVREATRIIDRLEHLHEVVDRVGLLVKTGERSFAPNPALVEARQQQQILGRILTTLRLPESWSEPERRPQRRGGLRGAYGPRSFRVVS